MIDRLPHRSPAEGCTCVVCHATRRQRFRDLSSAQRRAVGLLDAAIPRHPDDLRARGVRWKTLASLMQGDRKRPALVRVLSLREPLLHCPYYDFVLLTPHGADLVATIRKDGRLG